MESEEASEELKKLLKPGDTVYTVLRYVSRSGMMRKIDLFIIKEGRPMRITWLVAKALDYKTDKDGYLIVEGAGLDVGYALVYDLSYHLFKGMPNAGYQLRHSWI
jgi:hypothetical protein